MNTILKKELSSYLHSWRGYVFLAVSIFSAGVLSFICNFNYGSTKIEIWAPYLSLVLAVLSPFIFGNCFSKEREKNTEKLLFSLPFEARDIVLGKYFAVLCLFGIEICFLIVLPPIYSIFAEVNLLSAYSTLFGLALLCTSLVSIVFFIASTFNKRTYMLIVSYAVFAGLFAMSLVPIVRTSNIVYILTTLVHKLAFFSRLDNLIIGIFDLEAVIYYISVTFIFLILTLRNLEKRRVAVLSGGAL